ncbi:MAG: OB-fold domain-containing protein [Sandarakinorhabdus sp.]|nr:OB-fold domain-containing protein [Sandarakinorhabdus sp.]
MKGARPRPRLDADNRAFWTGGAAGELRIMQCRQCRGFLHPPRAVCRHCLSEDVAPAIVAGTGTVDSFTVNHQAWARDMEVPYVIARVALDDAPGVTLTTNIVRCEVDAVAIGDRVRVLFEEQDGIFYPLFEKAG